VPVIRCAGNVPNGDDDATAARARPRRRVQPILALHLQQAAYHLRHRHGWRRGSKMMSPLCAAVPRAPPSSFAPPSRRLLPAATCAPPSAAPDHLQPQPGHIVSGLKALNACLPVRVIWQLRKTSSFRLRSLPNSLTFWSFRSCVGAGSMRAVRLWVVFLGGSPARSLLSRKVEYPCHRTFDSISVPYTETGLEPLLARRREMITPVGWKNRRSSCCESGTARGIGNFSSSDEKLLEGGQVSKTHDSHVHVTWVRCQ
jgi:hypothetical protein